VHLFSLSIFVVSCYLSYRPILANVVDSLNCNDETVYQKLFFFKNTLKLAYGNVETYNFSGRHTPGRPLPGRGGEGRGSLPGDPPPLQTPRSATGSNPMQCLLHVYLLYEVRAIGEQ